jgi:radical SAM superfamily enzyme YgiQ (UPF0313 family)
MNVVIVRPATFLNADFHPLNIGYIFQSIVDIKNINVFFVDGEQVALKYRKNRDVVIKTPSHTMWKEISNEILAYKPDIIAFSCYTISMTSVKYIIDNLCADNYSGYIVAGGIHPTVSAIETLERLPGLDIVVIGEGDVTFKKLCEAVLNKLPLSEVDGIAYKKDGKIEICKKREMIKSLDSLPLPERRFSGSYIYNNHVILTSRGCPFVCDFCDSKNMWTRKVRYRSGEHVAAEILDITKLGVKFIGLKDDTFTLNLSHVEGVCKAIVDKNLNKFSYAVGSRIDTMNKECLLLLKKMNVQALTFGVETGSPELQKRIHKNLDVDTVVPVIERVNKAGISSTSFIMLGHPGESEDNINDTYALIRELGKKCKNNVVDVNIVCPYPGTGYWDYATKKYGKFIDFYKDSLTYHHESKFFVNMTNMSDERFNYHINRIMKLIKSYRLQFRIHNILTNPGLSLHKLKGMFPLSKITKRLQSIL